AGDFRLAHRSQHAHAGSRRGAARHRAVEPDADRRHALMEEPASSRMGRRALSADRATVPRGRGTRAGALVGIRARVRASPPVMRGLDPRIHLLPEEVLAKRWIAGSSPAMTASA